MTHVPIVFLPDEAGIDARRSRPRGGPHPVSPEGSSALETRGWAGGQVPPPNARPPSPLRFVPGHLPGGTASAEGALRGRHVCAEHTHVPGTRRARGSARDGARGLGRQ